VNVARRGEIRNAYIVLLGKLLESAVWTVNAKMDPKDFARKRNGLERLRIMFNSEL
jgi:hypothetical protein